MPPKRIEKGKEIQQIEVPPQIPPPPPPPHTQLQIPALNITHRTGVSSGYKNRVGTLKANTFSRLTKFLNNGKLTLEEYNTIRNGVET